MKMFSDCSGICNDCYFNYVNVCVTGHGDDNFCAITEKSAMAILKRQWVKTENDVDALFKKFPGIERKLKLDKINGKI